MGAVMEVPVLVLAKALALEQPARLAQVLLELQMLALEAAREARAAKVASGSHGGTSLRK